MNITNINSSISEFYKEEELKQNNEEQEIVSIPEGCPKCGNKGEFIRMALCCPKHGMFAGC